MNAEKKPKTWQQAKLAHAQRPVTEFYLRALKLWLNNVRHGGKISNKKSPK